MLAAAVLAAAVAVAVRTVCGTRRGMSGTVRLPSAAHSAQLPGPYTLNGLIKAYYISCGFFYDCIKCPYLFNGDGKKKKKKIF